MRRVWAAVLSVWSTLAIVGVLAWSHPVTPAARVVVLPNGTAVQTMTSSSQVAAAGGAQQLLARSGNAFVTQAVPQTVSGSS